MLADETRVLLDGYKRSFENYATTLLLKEYACLLKKGLTINACR